MKHPAVELLERNATEAASRIEELDNSIEVRREILKQQTEAMSKEVAERREWAVKLDSYRSVLRELFSDGRVRPDWMRRG